MSFEIVLRPKYFGDKKCQELADVCYPIAVNSFGVQQSEDFYKDVFKHVEDSSGLLIYRDERENAVAFCSWIFIPYGWCGLETILYLSGICVQKESQGNGIAKEIISNLAKVDARRQLPDKHAFCPLPPFSHVVFRTQSPRMKQMFDSAVGRGYEDKEDSTRVAKIAMQFIGSSMEEDTLVCRGVYGHCLYTEEQRANDERYNDQFARLDILKGDSQVCVWRN